MKKPKPLSAARKKALREAARAKHAVALEHLPFPPAREWTDLQGIRWDQLLYGCAHVLVPPGVHLTERDDT